MVSGNKKNHIFLFLHSHFFTTTDVFESEKNGTTDIAILPSSILKCQVRQKTAP